MKRIYSFIVFIALFINAQAQHFDWAKREGLWAYDYGYGITTDNAGNVYTTGKYEEVNANFSDTLVPCEGNHDIYVAKYTSGGILSWIRTAGGITGDYGTSIACDNSFVYVAGEIEALGQNETIVFPGSSITLNCMGANDIFLAKYDLDGNLLWAESAGGYGYEKALGVTYDQDGNVYICGLFRAEATFGGTTTIVSTSNGVNDIFLAKYNADGVFQWVRNAGSAGRDEAKSVMCDEVGNVYMSGMYSNGALFETETLAATPGYYDTFLAKYSTLGALQWVKTAGGDYDDVAWGVTIDNAGKIYIAGEYNAYALFDNISLTTSGMADVFVACYDATGTVQWATSGGGQQIDRARGIGCDGINLYITGQFGGTAGFGPSVLSAADSSDVFIAKLNTSGYFVNASSIGGVADSVETLGYESGNAICADASGNAYATGSLLDGGDFGTTSFDEYGRTDIFVTKVTYGADVSAPLAASYIPADNNIDVFNTTNLVLTFNEEVQKGTGNIILREGGFLTQIIDVAGANVVVSGNTVVINPETDFTDSAVVNVEMDAGVFKDMSDNDFLGIADATTWNFTIASTISIAESGTLKNFIIYPNPGTGNFTLELIQSVNQNTETIVFNCVGQIVTARTDMSSKINIDLSAQEKGIYFVQIKAEDQTISRGKIILQ